MLDDYKLAHTCADTPEVSCLRCEQVGILVPYLKGFGVVCTECFDSKVVMLKGFGDVAVWPANLARYRQPCLCCGKEVNPNASPSWPILFDGR